MRSHIHAQTVRICQMLELMIQLRFTGPKLIILGHYIVKVIMT